VGGEGSGACIPSQRCGGGRRGQLLLLVQQESGLEVAPLPAAGLRAATLWHCGRIPANISRVIATFLSVILALLPQSSDLRENYSDWYNVVEKRFGISGTFSSVHDVDFRNLRVYLVAEDGTIAAVRKLKNGRYSQPPSGPDGFQYIELGEVSIVPSGPGNPAHAVVTFVETTGGASSCNVGYVQVFELSNESLVLVQQIQYGWRGGPYKLDWNQGILLFDAVDFCDDFEPYKLRVQFHWDGTRFERKSVTKVSRTNR
jgi:hypothetical protein